MTDNKADNGTGGGGGHCGIVVIPAADIVIGPVILAAGQAYIVRSYEDRGEVGVDIRRAELYAPAAGTAAAGDA